MTLSIGSKVHYGSRLVFCHSHQSPCPPLLSSLLTIAPSLFPSLALQAAVSVAVAPGKARRTLTSSRILPNIAMQYSTNISVQYNMTV